MPIEDIKGILKENNNIAEDVKENIIYLINIFINAFPNVSLENLKKQLLNLKIQKVSKYVTTEYAYYNGNSNILYINYNKITDDDDVKHIMMHQLLNIITYNGKFSGFNQNNFLKALNIGFTEIITNNLVGNDGEVSYYDDEIVATNLLASIIGYETLEKCYFENDAKLVITSLIKVGGEI